MDPPAPTDLASTRRRSRRRAVLVAGACAVVLCAVAVTFGRRPLLLLGAVCEGAGWTHSAESLYGLALRYDSPDLRGDERTRALLARAQVRDSLGMRQEALGDLDRALAIDAGCLVALEMRARLRLVGQDFAAAADDLARATEKGAPDAATWERLSAAQLRAGKVDAALATAREGQRRFPRDSTLRNAEGACLVRRGDHERAVRAFDAAIALDPESWIAYFGRSICHCVSGRAAEAVADCWKADSLRPNRPATLVRLALAHSLAGDDEEALRALDRARALGDEGYRHALGRLDSKARRRLDDLTAGR